MSSSPFIRILLVDDHWLFRRAVRDLLQDDQQLRVVGEASSGEAAVAQARRLKPAVVVMDFCMPGMGGVCAIREIRMELPQVQIVMASVSAEALDVVEALKAGARGYFAKDDEPAVILEAVRQVADGKLYLASGVATSVCRLLAAENAVVAPPGNDSLLASVRRRCSRFSHRQAKP
ncbi:MAG: response regulator [Chloroflexota bacterium]